MSANARPTPGLEAKTVEALVQSRANPESRTTYAGEPPSGRTVYTALSLLSIMVLSLMIGSRWSKLRRNATTKRNITSMLVIALYILAITFIVCSAILLQGQGLYNYGLCYAATWVCLILYTACKLVIYVFLVERIHVVRAPYMPRSQDHLYLACMGLVLVSFAAVAINAYLSPVIKMDSSDGRCYMGIPGKASIPFMSVDIAVDVAVTAVFFWLLRPVIKTRGLSTITEILGVNASSLQLRMRKIEDQDVQAQGRETAVQRNIKILLAKSLIASGLIMLPTIANMIQFYIMQGHELALVCLSICTMDVAWDTIAIHWLTFGSLEAERNLPRSLSVPSSVRPEIILDLPQPKLSRQDTPHAQEPNKSFKAGSENSVTTGDST